MAAKKIVFLAAKPVGHACFAYLLEQCRSLDAEVTALLTHQRKEFGEGHDLIALAAAHGVPVLESLEELPECDIIYSIQYHEILGERHLAKARQAAVNLHMAPLPEYRGCNQFTWALLDGKEEFGTTIHMMSTGVDDGDILFQKRFPIPEKCWVKELYDLTEAASIKLFQQTLPHIVRGNYNPVPQSLLVPKYGTSVHYRREIAALKQLETGWDAEKTERYIRATSMPGFEPPYYFVDGKKMYISPGYSS
jgi:methionyl-tRNA formyltransferase